MKQIKYLALLLLTSCSNLHFDPVEYSNLIYIKENIINISRKCDNNVVSDVDKLKKLVDHQYMYVSGRSQRDEIKEAIKILKTMVDEFDTQYTNGTPSNTYCVAKTQLLDTSINMIIKGIGEL